MEKAKDAAVLRNGDSGDPSNASEPLAKRARTSQEHVPATPLHSEEIVARAEMCVIKWAMRCASFVSCPIPGP